MTSQHLSEIKKELTPIFKEVAENLSKDNAIEDRNLDEKVLSILSKKTFKNENIEINFSTPKDDIYNAEAGRTPYDLLIYGKIKNIPFKIFLNNKYGDINSDARNDTTTYNNLLRLYLDIRTQRLSENTEEINKDIIFKRISCEEIISYAIFVIDKNTRDYRFFFFEEIGDALYINPRNTMFQIKYAPTLRDSPLDFYDFVLSLIDTAIISLTKSVNKIKTEIIVLNQLKSLIVEMGRK